MLSLMECPLSSLSPSSQFKKRKRDDFEEVVLRDCKRRRLNSSSPMLMLNFNWPLVPHTRTPTFILSIAGEIVFYIQPFWNVPRKVFSLQGFALDQSLEKEKLPLLMLTYCWPVALRSRYADQMLFLSSCGEISMLVKIFWRLARLTLHVFSPEVLPPKEEKVTEELTRKRNWLRKICRY